MGQTALKIPAGFCLLQNFSPVPVLSPDKLPELKNSDLDFVFIDTPPYLSNKLPELCSLANVIIIPTKAGVFDVLAIRSTIEIVKQSKGEKKALIVFNMVKPNTSLTEEIKSQLNEYNITVAQTMVSDLVAFSRSALHNGVEDNKKALALGANDYLVKAHFTTEEIVKKIKSRLSLS